MTDIKYTNEDIERIFKERVKYIQLLKSNFKSGVICEWVFEYPNGQIIADVETAFCISFCVSPENFDSDIMMSVCQKKIKDKLWEICGKYSLITGEKL